MTPMPTPTIAFLHTARIHTATFDALLAQYDVALEHVVEESWLKRARDEGISEQLRDTVLTHFRDAAERASVVVCTCSTLGPIAQEAGLENVFRVDSPMMDAAAGSAKKVMLALCLESTVRPSSELLEGSFKALGVAPNFDVVLCSEAWAYFERGDSPGFAAEVARVIREAFVSGRDSRGDSRGLYGCVVLAQASMAGAASHLDDLGVPVLSSPGMAVDAALELAGVT
ncbi:MAG: hypothetical protein ACI9W2_003749 [Gammaproteobacteria bacterium]|jgi:hypothetical protein